MVVVVVVRFVPLQVQLVVEVRFVLVRCCGP